MEKAASIEKQRVAREMARHRLRRIPFVGVLRDAIVAYADRRTAAGARLSSDRGARLLCPPDPRSRALQNYESSYESSY